MRRSLTIAAAILLSGNVASLPATAGVSDTPPIQPASEIGERLVPNGMLVHLTPDAPWRAGLRDAEAAGTRIGTRYRMIKVFVAYGTRASFRALAATRHVDYLEPNAGLRLMTDTSHSATRGQHLFEGNAYKKISPRPITGDGVGIAVVDTGVDGTHPDLASQMVSNVRIVCSNPGVVIGTMRECGGPKTAVELDDTDTPGAGGHGTHVAGIVASTGDASEGKYGGAAPGASLYGVGIGTVILVENALDGLRWVLDSHDKVSPRIRVVNNSWGGPHADPNDPFVSATTKLVDLLVAEGITVVFAAGNGGGGSTPTTSAQCVNPTPGVICVSNYDDGGTGSRDGVIDASSSRGVPGDARTWPDVAAPGTSVTSTCRVYLPVCLLFGNTRTQPYGSMTGTSMAAPHVAGIIAQMLQIAPSLKPAVIEDILEDTAHAFKAGGAYEVDPHNRTTKSSFDKGHGLVDAYAAVTAARARRKAK